MATMTKEKIQDEFIQFLRSSYGYWTDLEHSQEAISYLSGACDFMFQCVRMLDKAESETDDCGK